MTKEEFISKCISKHGNRFDYSEVDYKGNKVKVCIICKKHGKFHQTPNGHLTKKIGCPKCLSESRKKLIYGIGVNDSSNTIYVNGKMKKSYLVWRSMIARCYSKNLHKNRPTYIDCEVCEEWKYFSNFERWFDENYVQDWCLDKDLLLKGNKVYSPSKCVFVPVEINSSIVKCNSNRGSYPIGVTKRRNGKFRAMLCEHGFSVKLGDFNNFIDAFIAYKHEKESYLKRLGDKYKNQLSKAAYNALMKYEVFHND